MPKNKLEIKGEINNPEVIMMIKKVPIPRVLKNRIYSKTGLILL